MKQNESKTARAGFQRHAVIISPLYWYTANRFIKKIMPKVEGFKL